MRRRIAASVAAAAVAVGVVATAPASQAAPAPLRYVALGDSYSAASGNVPPDPTAAPQCLRSTANYPHVIAGAIGAQLTDVTCGAADTSDYFTAQYHGVPPQLAALTADTQLVTMTIGGNDSNVFINSIVECGAAGALDRRPGQPLQGQVRLLVRGHHPEHDLPVAGPGPEGGAREVADGEGRDPGLPVDPAADRRLLRQDADRDG